MPSYLINFEPSNRANCLCGSGLKFKNCCKNEYLKKKFNVTSFLNKKEYSKSLKSIRSYITWYRLCHNAHTKPLLETNTENSLELLEIDIEALSDLMSILLRCYDKSNILDKYLITIEELKNAINAEKWRLKIDYHKCIYFYYYKDNRKEALSLLRKYSYENIDDVYFLTLYLDVNSNEINQVEKINIIKKIRELTKSVDIKLQYSVVEGIQYCLLNDFEKGIPLIIDAINIYEQIDEDERTIAGRHYLSLAYKNLGELLDSRDYISKSIQLLESELNKDNYTAYGYSEIWSNLGDSYYYQNNWKESLSAYDNSLKLNKKDLTKIFKARVLIKMDKTESAKDLLNGILVKTLSEENFFDYVISKCMLAIKKLNKIDIEESLTLIKKIRIGDPLFKDIIQDLTVELYETMNKSNNTNKVESALKKFNRYVSLKPNLFGIGMDINAMIDDIISN